MFDGSTPNGFLRKCVGLLRDLTAVAEAAAAADTCKKLAAKHAAINIKDVAWFILVLDALICTNQ